MVQGGAGTSVNMNANEVIANRALEIMGHEKADYQSAPLTTIATAVRAPTTFTQLLSAWL